MPRGEMNQVQTVEFESGFCNYKWLVLGTCQSATYLEGWMWHPKKVWFAISLEDRINLTACDKGNRRRYQKEFPV